MTEHFCTSFDHRYAPRGLAMWESLKALATSPILHVLCLTDACFSILSELGLPDVRLYVLSELEREDADLAATRAGRTLVEYYFTITPSVPLMVFRHAPDVRRVTYVDADLYFFSDPQPVFDELGDASIGLIEHRFPEGVDGTAHGRFNVGWLTFRQTPEALSCLERWREQCIDWCHDRSEPGRFADQKYLDQWPTSYKGVHVIAHTGANLAPWNLNRFAMTISNGIVMADGQRLIFFHAHGFKPASPGSHHDCNLADYDVPQDPLVRCHIYEPYEAALNRATTRIAQPLLSALLAEDVRAEARLLEATRIRLSSSESRYADLAAAMASVRATLEASEMDRADRLAMILDLGRRLEAVEADRAARLTVIDALQRRLEVSEADRAARLSVIDALQQRLDVSEADRAARLTVIGALQRRLEAAEADRVTGLAAVETLRVQLERTEADREASLRSIDGLLREQNAREAVHAALLQGQRDDSASLRDSLDEVQTQLGQARARLAAVEGSRTWRWTAPVRRVLAAAGFAARNERRSRFTATASPAESSFRAWVDSPVDGEPLPTHLLIRGWCYSIAGIPITDVRASAGMRRYRGVYGERRPDVAAAFGPDAVPLDCGYQIPLTLGSARTADLQVSLDGHGWQTVQTLSFNAASRVSLKSRAEWLRFWWHAWTGRPDGWNGLSVSERDYAVAKMRVHGWLNLAPSPQHPPQPAVFERLPSSRLSAEQLPRLAVVTPSFQQAPYLGAAIRSVLDQEGVRVHYAVQDGGSTDGSVDIIRGYAAQLDHWESSPDAGQAAAIVRGFSKIAPSADDVMMYLNSDDQLVPGAARFVADYFARHPDVDVVYGHRLMVDHQGREVGRWITPRLACDDYRIHDFVPQETLFWRRRIWDRVGGLDPAFAFALDWDLILRFHEAGARFSRLPWFLGCFRLHPLQKTAVRVNEDGLPEMNKLRLRSLGRTPTDDELHLAMCRAQVDSALVNALLRRGIRI